MKYDFSAIESKWQQKWDEAGIFRASDDHTKPKFYGLSNSRIRAARVCTSDISRHIRDLR